MKRHSFSLFMLLLTATACFENIVGGTTGPLTWSIRGATLTISGKGAMPDYDDVYAPWHSYQNTFTEVEIAEGVTSVGNNAFADCEKLVSITLPCSVTKIEDWAFANCPELEYITVHRQDPLDVLEHDIFSSMNISAKKLIVPEGTSESYRNAEAWQNFIIEDTSGRGGGIIKSTTLRWSIYNNALNVHGVGPMKDYDMDDRYNIPWHYYQYSITSVEVEEGVTSIGAGIFSFCNALTSAVLPDNLTSIGDYAFYACSSLSSFPLPNSITGIGARAFAGCSSFTSVDLPKSITMIGAEAFGWCDLLTSVTVHWQDPLEIEESVFEGLPDISNTKLIVPKGTVDLYRAAKGWKDFTIEESDFTGRENVH